MRATVGIEVQYRPQFLGPRQFASTRGHWDAAVAAFATTFLHYVTLPPRGRRGFRLTDYDTPTLAS